MDYYIDDNQSLQKKAGSNEINDDNIDENNDNEVDKKNYKDNEINEY